MIKLILPLYFCLMTPFLLGAHEQLQEADHYFQATLFDKALPLYIDLSKEKLSQDDHNRVMIRLAQSYAALGEFNKAIAVLQDQQDRESLDFLALLYAQNHDYAKAYQALQKYFDLYGNRANSGQDALYLRAGEALIFQGSFDLANSYFEKITPASPLYPKAQLYLAQIDLQNKKGREVIARLTPLKSDLIEFEKERTLLLAEAYFQSEDFKQTATFFQKSFELENGKQTAWKLPAAERLLFAYARLNESEKGKALLNQLEKELPPGEFSYLKGRYYLLQAEQAKDPEESRTAYSNAASAYSAGYDALKANNEALALRALNASAEADARTGDADCCKRALKHLQQLGTSDIGSSAKSSGELAYFQGLLAASLVESGQLPPQQVIEQIEQSLAVDPADATAAKRRFLIAILYYKQGRYDEAKNHFLKLPTTLKWLEMPIFGQRKV